MKNYTKVNLTSSNLSEEKQAELRHILPEVFSEDKIDWEKLRLVLGESALEHIEKFSFTWAGKNDAIKNVLIPSKGTLRADTDESIKFDENENLFIEGDNLEVLKLLQKAYFEKVKMIYIDPPYNTGGDFVYRDNFTAPLKGYMEQTGQVDSEGNKLKTNKETNGRFHSDWLSMMYPRLKLAWNLLKDDGVIFVSIDDNEGHRLRMIMDEVFGEEKFVAQIVRRRRNSQANLSKDISPIHEYIICYKKSGDAILNKIVTNIKTEDYKNSDNDSRGGYVTMPCTNKGGSIYEITTTTGVKYTEEWRFKIETYEQLLKENRIVFPSSGNGKPRYKIFLSEKLEEGMLASTWFEDVASNQEGTRELKDIFSVGGIVFENPKPVGLLQKLLQLATIKNNDEIVLDFFAGSGTTAHAVLKQNQEDGGNRKFILVQLPEATDVESETYKAGYKSIADISKERIRRVIKGYGDTPQPIDDGFKVFKLGASNYRENQFEFDPEKPEEENKKSFEEYLAKAKQALPFDEVNVSDIIYENIVKEGFSFNAKITESKIGENTVYTVSDGEMQFLICLDRKVGDETVRALTGADYKGQTVICFDSALDDTAKANLGLNVELKTI